MKIVAFVPIKLNNERTPGKNIRPLCDGTPLIQCILQSLKQVPEINDIYVYCSKEEVKDYLPENIHYIKRSEKYDTATADVNDMFYAFSQEVLADIYVLAHATCPFTRPESISRGIQKLVSGDYDSAIAVKKVQDFMWQEEKPINYSLEKIPRTQDLKPYFMETTGLYIFTNDVIGKLKRRIGKKPYMLEVSEKEAIDIDEEEDFEMANAVYSYELKKIGGGY